MDSLIALVSTSRKLTALVVWVLGKLSLATTLATVTVWHDHVSRTRSAASRDVSESD